MSTTTTNEYDRFGPWIDDVTTPDEVPRVFRSYPVDPTTARLVLKVPRNIARRDATPDMDLYDHLVILEGEMLTLLSRRKGTKAASRPADDGQAYDVVAVALADVVAIRNDLNLLEGRLTVSTLGGDSIAMPYNGSARGKATWLVNELRAAGAGKEASDVGRSLMAAGKASPGVTTMPQPGDADTHLVSRFLELNGANPDLAVWASDVRRRVTPVLPGARGFLTRAVHVASPMTLHGTALIGDGTAFEILGRHASLVRGRAAIYSSSRLVIPFSGLDRLDLAPHPVYPAVAVATFAGGAWQTAVCVPTDSGATRLLREAATSVAAFTY